MLAGTRQSCAGRDNKNCKCNICRELRDCKIVESSPSGIASRMERTNFILRRAMPFVKRTPTREWQEATRLDDYENASTLEDDSPRPKRDVVLHANGKVSSNSEELPANRGHGVASPTAKRDTTSSIKVDRNLPTVGNWPETKIERDANNKVVIYFGEQHTEIKSNKIDCRESSSNNRPTNDEQKSSGVSSSRSSRISSNSRDRPEGGETAPKNSRTDSGPVVSHGISHRPPLSGPCNDRASDGAGTSSCWSLNRIVDETKNFRDDLSSVSRDAIVEDDRSIVPGGADGDGSNYSIATGERCDDAPDAYEDVDDRPAGEAVREVVVKVSPSREDVLRIEEDDTALEDYWSLPGDTTGFRADWSFVQQWRLRG